MEKTCIAVFADSLQAHITLLVHNALQLDGFVIYLLALLFASEDSIFTSI